MIVRIFHGSMVILCLIGCIIAWLPLLKKVMHRNAVLIARFASILLVYFTLLDMAGVLVPRYAVPLRPYLYGMTVLGLYVSFRAIKARGQEFKPKAGWG